MDPSFPAVLNPRPENSTNGRASISPGLRSALGFADRWLPPLGAFLAGQLFTTPPRFSRPPEEARVLATAEAFSLPVSLEGRVLEVAAWRWDEDRLGLRHRPVALLVHGWGGRGGQLHPLVGPLVSAGYAVVCFDMPAHGDTAGRRTHLVAFTHTLAAVVRHLGRPALIVTHSMGGGAALHAATADWAEPDARRQLVGVPVAFLAPPMDPPSFATRFGAQMGLSLRTVRTLEANFEASIGLGFAEVAFPPAAARFSAPAFVAHDVDDTDVPLAAGLAFARGVDARDVLVTRGLGHRRILKDPEVIGRVLAFAAAAQAR